MFVSPRLPRCRQCRGVRGQVFGADSQYDDRNHRHCAFSFCSWLFLVVCGCSWLFSSFHQNHCALSVVCACFLVVRGCLIVPSRTLSQASLTDIVFFCILLCSFVLILSSGRSLPPHTQGRVRSTGVRPEQTVMWDVPTQLHHRRGQRHGMHAMPHHRREHCSVHAWGVFGGVVGDCSSRHADSIPWVR